MVDLIINGDSQTLDGIHTYDYINITNGGILYVTPYDGTGTKGTLILNVIGINVDSTSSIIGTARGYLGGLGGGYPRNFTFNGGEGGQISGSGGGSNGQFTTNSFSGSGGGGGGGYGTTGGAGGSSAQVSGGAGGITKGTSNGTDIDMGSGAGGGGACSVDGRNEGSPGMAGGGMLTINGTNINIHGIVNFNGGNGGNGGACGSYGGGGGGASGGGILFNGTNINIINSSITTDGGAGGTGNNQGGSGGGGRIKMFYSGTYNNFGATTSSGTTYIEGPTSPAGNVCIFNSFPSGATIIIDDIDMLAKTNAQFEIPFGVHNYILRLECYQDIAGQINVVLGPPTTVSGSFIKNTGDLSITSQPTDANVYFGPTLQGQTPLSYICYPEGDRSYYISLFGYQAFIGTVNVVRNLLTEINAQLVPVGPPGVGSIYIMSNPPGANVFVDNIEQIGKTTPVVITDIEIGPHNVELRKVGYNSSTSSITIADNETSVITLSLGLIEDMCSWITSKGGWANISIFDIMTLVSAYLQQTNLGFTVTISHIMGAVAYYLNNMSSGNSLTGCSFT